MSNFNPVPISQLTLATSINVNDVVPIVDVTDPTQSPSGTTKKCPISLLTPFPILQTTVTTTNNTPTTILSIPVSTSVGNIVTITAQISALYVTGTLAIDKAAYSGLSTASAFYNTTSSTVISAGTLPTISFTGSSAFAVSAAWVVSGNNLQLHVTGLSLETIAWACNYSYFIVNK